MRHFPDKSCSIEYLVGKCVLKAYCGTFTVAEDVIGQEGLRWGPMSMCKHTGPEQAMLKAAVVQVVSGCCPGSCPVQPSHHIQTSVGCASPAWLQIVARLGTHC